MFKYIFIVIMILCAISAQGQELTVIGSAGAESEAATGSLSWTIGEVITQTFSDNAQHYLTQGFHQPAFVTVTGLGPLVESVPTIYPNPVRDILNVAHKGQGDYRIELFSLQGQKLFDLQTSEGPGLTQIDMHELAIAMYLLRITSRATQSVVFLRIEKY